MKSQNRLAVIDIEAVKSRMLTVRSHQVLLDRDVAELYGVQTKEINQAVRNNPDKFPVGYTFRLDKKECDDLRSKFLTANIPCGRGDIGGSREMNKTLTIIRPGESHDDYSWALKLSDAERIGLADKLLRDLWIAAHGQPYPPMDRTIVRLARG